MVLKTKKKVFKTKTKKKVFKTKKTMRGGSLVKTPPSNSKSSIKHAHTVPTIQSKSKLGNLWSTAAKKFTGLFQSAETRKKIERQKTIKKSLIRHREETGTQPTLVEEKKPEQSFISRILEKPSSSKSNKWYEQNSLYKGKRPHLKPLSQNEKNSLRSEAIQSVRREAPEEPLTQLETKQRIKEAYDKLKSEAYNNKARALIRKQHTGEIGKYFTDENTAKMQIFQSQLYNAVNSANPPEPATRDRRKQQLPEIYETPVPINIEKGGLTRNEFKRVIANRIASNDVKLGQMPFKEYNKVVGQIKELQIQKRLEEIKKKQRETLLREAAKQRALAYPYINTGQKYKPQLTTISEKNGNALASVRQTQFLNLKKSIKPMFSESGQL